MKNPFDGTATDEPLTLPPGAEGLLAKIAPTQAGLQQCTPASEDDRVQNPFLPVCGKPGAIER